MEAQLQFWRARCTGLQDAVDQVGPSHMPWNRNPPAVQPCNAVDVRVFFL